MRIWKTQSGRMKRTIAAWLLLLFCLFFATSPASAKQTKIMGIDVSRWQGSINWKQVKASGVKFAMIGMGRYYSNGSYYLDSRFKENVKGAYENGIHVGVYLYSLAKSKSQAKKEAKWVISQLEGYKISYPVAFDMEDPSVQGLSVKKKTDIALAFMKTIEAAGYYPAMYASENWFKTGIDNSRIEKYDKWVARWSTGMTYSPVSMWQYTNKGRIGGISGAVDLDYSYKDYSKLITPRFHAANAKVKTGWGHNSAYYWYVNKDGTSPSGEFKTIKKKTYYFNTDGYRLTGWQKIGKKYYYFSKKGVLKKGWITVGGKKYYTDPNTGERRSGWLTIGKKKYYLNKKTGELTLGWKKISKVWYYFNKKTGVLKKESKTAP